MNILNVREYTSAEQLTALNEDLAVESITAASIEEATANEIIKPHLTLTLNGDIPSIHKLVDLIWNQADCAFYRVEVADYNATGQGSIVMTLPVDEFDIVAHYLSQVDIDVDALRAQGIISAAVVEFGDECVDNALIHTCGKSHNTTLEEAKHALHYLYVAVDDIDYITLSWFKSILNK